MKTYRFTPVAALAFALAAISPASGAEQPKSVADTFPSTRLREANDGSKALAGSPPITQVAATENANAAGETWADIKDKTYDMRAQFFVGLNQLEARVDDQVRELTAKRAAMTSIANTKDWDFAMKEMGDARSYLRSTGDELREASPETWDQGKDKVGKAWVRTQEAYAKVKSSTTN